MKKIIVILTAILVLSSCGIPENAEEATTPTATTATTTATTSQTLPAAETTTAATTKTTQTEAITVSENPAPEADKTFPIIDGSTSTIALDAYFRSKILDISPNQARRQTNHNKTFEAFENLVNGRADIVLSVPLAKEQEAYAAEHGFEYEAVPVAMEGFVFLVNPKNPVQSLTQEQIKKIYSGEITNWKDLGGNDAPIEAYQRNADSGSQTYMVEFMGETPLTIAPREFVQIDMGGVVAMFSDYDNSVNAIGYSVYSYAAVFAANEGTFNFVEVDGVKPSRTTFFDGSYPLLSETYAFYKKDTTDTLVLDYIEYITSEEGQNAVLEAGYIPVMDIEIPAAYTLYEAKGTGPAAPEKTNWNRYSLDLNIDYDYETRPRGFLKDAEFEAEIQTWIDEAEDYYDEMAKTVWVPEYYACQYYAEIENGYLSISVGYRYCEGVGAFWELYGKSAVFDLVNKKKIENLSDMFYKDADFLPPLNSSISTELKNKTYGSITQIEFFGLCSDFTFDLTNISFPIDNAYADFPASFYLNLINRENSVVSHCRDFTDLITPEYAKQIKYIELKPTDSTSPTENYYEKNGHVYTYFDYPNKENDRELPENKRIEEMLDAWFADNGYDNAFIYISTEGAFVYLIFPSEGQRVYCTLQHKFIMLEDLFKDGFTEHLEVEPDKYKDTSKEIFNEYYAGNWYNTTTENVITQLYDENDDDYLIISYYNTPELRIDRKWLKDIYQNLPEEN
jgi:phosphate transport system substrate-binding protein